MKSRRSLGVYFVSCLFPSSQTFRPACGESQDSKTHFRENPERGVAPQHLLPLGGEILSVIFVYLRQFPVNMYTICNTFLPRTSVVNAFAGLFASTEEQKEPKSLETDSFRLRGFLGSAADD